MILSLLSGGGNYTKIYTSINKKKHCQKVDIFSKKLTKIVIFSTKLPMAILLKKMTIFVNFFEKNVYLSVTSTSVQCE